MDSSLVLKFGGSSVSNNENLKIVANKIINYYKKNKRIVVILSAQGNETDRLIKEAKELCNDKIDSRELDTLISTGEQVSAAKLAMLLKSMNYNSVSLTGWQAGIYTNDTNQNAIIENINTSRIINELNLGNIVIITGFQGINKKLDITTLGRGGSDTTALAVAAALNADKCYIYSDVDGIYNVDPKKYKNAIKNTNMNYNEMLELSEEGAKVLHERSVEIGKKFNIPIYAKSTFEENEGTIISSKTIEENIIKSIVTKNVTKISFVGNGILRNYDNIKKVINLLEENKMELLSIEITNIKISVILKNTINDKTISDIYKKFIQDIY